MTVVSAWDTSPSASRAVSSRDAWPVTTWRMREFSTATPAIEPSSSRAPMSCCVKLDGAAPAQAQRAETPVLPRMGVSASFTVTACVSSLRPLNMRCSSVTALRSTVSPSRTFASGPSIASGSWPSMPTQISSGWNSATRPAS